MRPQIIEVGWYHPSQANWSYHIFMIVDKSGSRLYRSTFGGEKRLKYTGAVDYSFAGKGSDVEYRWKNIKDLFDIEKYEGKNWGKGSLGYNN